MTADVLTLAEVAQRLRISHATVYRLAASGKLPGTKVGRAWRFDAATIEQLVATVGQAADLSPHLQREEKRNGRDLDENSPDICLSGDGCKVSVQRNELISSGLIETIVGDLADAVLVIDKHCNLVYMNQLARQFLQLGSTETATQNDLRSKLEIYAADGATLLDDAQWPCARALRGETVCPTDYLFVTQEGTRYWMTVRSMPLRDANQNLVGCVCVLHNSMQDRQREQQWRLTDISVEHSPDAVFWVRPDGGLAYVNQRACQSLGYTKDELLQLSVSDFDPDVSREKWPRVWATLKQHQRIHLETRHRTKLGRIFPVEILSTYVEFEGVEYGVAHVRDISNRRRADVQLKESEARFQRAVAGSRDGIWDWDVLSGAVWFSPQYLALMGYKAQADVPKHVDCWIQCVHPDDKKRVMEAVDQHLAGVAPYDIEYRQQVQSGEYRWFRAKAQAFWDEDGCATRMTGTTSDITEQRHVLDVLEHQRRRMQMLIRYTPAAVAMFDREMRYISHSDQWLKDYGLEGQCLIGRTHYEVFPDVPQCWKEIHQECLNGKIRECAQDCFPRADGTEVWLEWAIHPWTNDEGEIGGIVMFTNVVTQRILTEKALEKARRDAESANLAKSEFLANMSHEIRTPLTAILGFAEHLRDRQSDAESIELCETIERNGGHLLELINDILDLSKVEAGCIDVLPEACNPGLLTREIANTLQGRADLKGLSLHVDLASDLPVVCQLDVRRYRQVLINLLGNAIKFTPHGSVTAEVRTATDEAGNWLEMTVKDTGIGVPQEKLSRLFEPFSQIDSSTTRAQGGTGLGLCISRRLARLCGGDISVISEANVGSAFTLRLPLIPVASSTTEVPQRSASRPTKISVTQDGVVQQPARILVAEDSADNRRLLDFLLKRAGHAPTFVENGQQLVDRLWDGQEESDFDIVLLDMQMPVLDGYSAARILRERGCSIPLIALTASAMDGDREKCLYAGCDDFVTKPINRSILEETLTAWSRQIRGTRPHALGRTP